MTETAAGDELETSLTSADSSRLLLNIADMSQVLYGVWYRRVTTEGYFWRRKSGTIHWLILFICIYIWKDTTVNGICHYRTQPSITGVEWDCPQLWDTSFRRSINERISVHLCLFFDWYAIRLQNSWNCAGEFPPFRTETPICVCCNKTSKIWYTSNSSSNQHTLTSETTSKEISEKKRPTKP